MALYTLVGHGAGVLIGDAPDDLLRDGEVVVARGRVLHREGRVELHDEARDVRVARLEVIPLTRPQVTAVVLREGVVGLA